MNIGSVQILAQSHKTKDLDLVLRGPEYLGLKFMMGQLSKP